MRNTRINIFNPDIEEFFSKYNEMKSSKKLGEFYGMNKTTILNFAKKVGFDTSQFKASKLLTDKEEQEIAEMYFTQNSTSLAKQYNCSPKLISKIWRNHNLSGKETRRYYSNFSYFNKIDSVDKSYFLGFIASDGCVYARNNDTQQQMLSIGINQKDEEVLIKFLKYIEGENPINNHYADKTYVSQIQIVSDELCNDLSKYNIVPRKTWSYCPTNIPEEFMWHFIRGFFDGDGSISWSKNSNLSKCNINFCGNKKNNDIYIRYS